MINIKSCEMTLAKITCVLGVEIYVSMVEALADEVGSAQEK